MKTNLPQHHNDAIEQMLDAAYDAEDEHALLLQLKAVAAYVEQAIGTEYGGTYFVFDSHGTRRIAVVKCLRSVIRPLLGLKNALALADSGPWLIGCQDSAQASRLVLALREVGASISVRNEAQMTSVDRASKGTLHE